MSGPLNPDKPTTQVRNERFHQTLFRWLDKQPQAQSDEGLQEQVDRLDLIYYTQRPYQGLPARITPEVVLGSYGRCRSAET